MISRETVTPLNYRTAVPSGSNFSLITKFPEVYHGQGISKAGFSGGERAVAGQGSDTTYSAYFADDTATSCVMGPQSAGGSAGDPELPFFGSQRKKRRKRIGHAYPYA